MTSKERLLRALNREKPDRLPVTVHQWQKYHRDVYLDGIGELEAFRRFGLDAAVQYTQTAGSAWADVAAAEPFATPEWRDEARLVRQGPGSWIARHTIHTSGGTLTYQTESDRKTTWITEYLIKRDDDLRLIEKYMPVPLVDIQAVVRLYDAVGDYGMVRSFVWGEQAGCWQHAACLLGVTELIMKAYDQPDWIHALLRILLTKKLRFIESLAGAKIDLVETGGGAASSTVISPEFFREFCLPYDRAMHDALHALGFRVVYHTCGGTSGIEELIVANGCDASETLAPKSIGGNQYPWEMKAKVGNRIALIGGLDQWNVLTRGSTREIRDQVRRLFATVGADGGYILSCADHFFDAPVANLKAYADAARECRYG